MPVGAPSVARVATPFLESNRLLSLLSPTDLSLLAPDLRDISLSRGALLHDIGDPVEHVYFPRGGMISLLAVMQTGETVETATIGREGAVGLAAGLGSRSAAGRAVVQLPGAAARISATRLHAAASQSSAIHDLAVRYNDLLISQIQQSVACNALHHVEARLCRWLLQTHDRVGGDLLPLTQELLGQMLGVRRTTVTIVARVLQRTGMIRYRRGIIQILDRHALEDGACECYAAIRQQIDHVLPISPVTLSPWS
jgi:CRP-like cAMP-binding protein